MSIKQVNGDRCGLFTIICNNVADVPAFDGSPPLTPIVLANKNCSHYITCALWDM